MRNRAARRAPPMLLRTEAGAFERLQDGGNRMKRLMNAVDAMLDESLDGFAAAHADIVELGADRKFVRRRP